MPRFIIHHVTKYSYVAAVRDSANQLMLFPLKDEGQELLSQQLVITGMPTVEMYRDYYGNEIGTFMNVDPHKELLIDSKIEIITRKRPLPADAVPPKEQWDYLQTIKFVIPFIDFLKQENTTSLGEVKKIADIEIHKNESVFNAAQKLNEYVYKNFKYIKGVTTTETTLDEIWKIKAGVCQDFAHILLSMLRLLNIPARYVSGYVCPHDHNLRGEGATHAWVEAYIPFYGWLGLDPTNNCVVDDLHVRLAIGKNFSDCSPVKGTYKGTSTHVLEVGVSVSYEDGGATKNMSPTLKPQAPSTNKDEPMNNNSYRRHMQMIQQQQQQQ
jgi:transglutaminase-like putative cysteine protease